MNAKVFSFFTFVFLFVFISCSQASLLVSGSLAQDAVPGIADNTDPDSSSPGIVSAPSVFPPNGGATSSDGLTVTLTPSNDGSLYYTLDGSVPTLVAGTPDPGTTLYTDPIVITEDTIVSVIETDDDGNTSPVVKGEFTIGNYVLAFDLNGGDDDDSLIVDHNYDSGESVTLTSSVPGVPLAYGDNGVFKEWNTSSDGSGTSYASGDSYTMGASDTTLYAQWTNKYAFTPSGGDAVITGWNPDYTPTVGEDSRMVIGSAIYDGTSTYTVTSIDTSAFENDTIFTTVSLPNTLERIEGSAFVNTNLTDIVVPDSVTYIGYFPADSAGAFEDNSSLTSVTIGSGVGSVEDSFYGSNNIASVVLKSGVGAIGNNAFSGITSLSSITIPDSVTSIGTNAFSNTALVNVTLGSGITVIPDSLFAGITTLETVTIEGAVTMIGESAFQGTTSLTDITLPDSVSTMGAYAFQNSGLTSIRLPDSLTELPLRAFSGASDLVSVDLNNLVELGDQDNSSGPGTYVFENTASLTGIVIPGSVTYIDEYAFRGSGIAFVTMLGSVPPVLRAGQDFGDNAGPLHRSSGLRGVAAIQVPFADIAAYISGTGWGAYSDILMGY